MLYKIDTKSGLKFYLDGKQVKQDTVPAVVANALADLPDGTEVDELGEVYDPKTQTEESKNEAAPTKDEVDNDSTDDSAQDQVSDQSHGTPTPQSEDGFGFKRAKGKTLSVFSDVPHETVKQFGGIMVPMTHEEYNTKTDGEIITVLKKLKKL